MRTGKMRSRELGRGERMAWRVMAVMVLLRLVVLGESGRGSFGSDRWGTFWFRLAVAEWDV